MVLAMVVLAAVQPLHQSVSYEVAEVSAGGAVLARVLCISTAGVDESVMSDEQRQQRAGVLRRIDATWANEDKRGRARLSVALSRAEDVAPRAREDMTSCRFLLPDEHVVRADFLLTNPTESQAAVVEDLDSGEYLSVLRLGERSQLPELLAAAIGRTFTHGKNAKDDEAARNEAWRRAREEAERAGAKTRAVAEVNGQRDLLQAGASEDDIAHALAAMWDNLDGEPRERISRVLAMLGAVENLRPKGSDLGDWPIEMDLLGSAFNYPCLPIPPPPDGMRFHKTTRWNEGLLDLQAPPEGVVTPFYGTRGWTPPDFSLSFSAQVRRLLRGDRD